jgi:hypothetical protein
VFCGAAVVGLAVGTVAAVCAVTAAHGFRQGWQGIPAFFLTSGVIGRIANCKVELRPDEISVVNPLRTYSLPMSSVRGACVDEGGTLVVQFGAESEAGAYAFGGSLVDRLMRTSDSAAVEIRGWVRAHAAADGAGSATPEVRWTRARFADLSLGVCVVGAGVGAVLTLLTGG